MGPKGRPDTKTNWSPDCRLQDELQLELLMLSLLFYFLFRLVTYLLPSNLTLFNDVISCLPVSM
jgi:hypothetical protein